MKQTHFFIDLSFVLACKELDKDTKEIAEVLKINYKRIDNGTDE